MKSPQAWSLLSDSKKGFPYPDFSSHKGRACSSHRGIPEMLGTSPDLQFLPCMQQVILMTLGFGGDPKKRVLPGCVTLESRKQRADLHLRRLGL